MYISSSYAKILGETNFRTREIPRSGSKAKDGEKKKKRILQGLRVAQAAKILCEKLFHTWEIPRSGSKAEDGEEKTAKNQLFFI